MTLACKVKNFATALQALTSWFHIQKYPQIVELSGLVCQTEKVFLEAPLAVIDNQPFFLHEDYYVLLFYMSGKRNSSISAHAENLVLSLVYRPFLLVHVA